MIVYLEGPDGSGKSTLSDALTKALIDTDMYVVQTKDGRCNINTHPRSIDRNTAEELICCFTEMAYDDAVYILDRGPISDVIYRMFDDYEPVLRHAQVLDLLHMLNNKVITIFCDTDIAEQRMLERGDDNPIAIAKHKEITQTYRNVMRHVRHRAYDYTKVSLSHFVEIVLKDIENLGGIKC